MKKILCSIVACVMLAGTVFSAGSDPQFGFAPPIKGITWGMSYDAVANQLNLPKNDALYAKGKTSSLINKNAVVFNQKATVEFLFDENHGVGLSGISVVFPKMNMNSMRAQLDKVYGKERIAYEWDSIKISGLPKTIQDRLKYINVDVIKKSGAAKLAPQWKDIQNRVLVTVSLVNTHKLSFWGQDMAAYNLCSNDDAYNQYVNWINTMINAKKTASK